MGGSSDSDSDSLDGEPLTQLPSPVGAAAAVEVGARVAKYFGDELYFGTASSYDAVNEFWFVNYDDGDEEEFEQEEFKAVQRLYRKHKDKDPRVRQLAKEKKERRRTLERTLLHHRRQRLAEDRTTKSKPVGFQLR